MSQVSSRRRRRLVVFGGTAAAAFMLVASLGWACTTPEGSTFFADGKTSKTVTRGTRISAYGLNANTSVMYKLVIGENGPHPTHACMVTDFTVNNGPKPATIDGFIGVTSGPAGNASLAAGTYQLCFTDYLNGGYSTSAATLTLL